MRILVTGGAGFIGSNLAEALLNDKRVLHVRVLDNLLTGSLNNISTFLRNPKFEFIKGDITDYATCLSACSNIDLISHQAALGSVPRSINDPLTTNQINITGTLNIFTAAKEKKIKRIVYAGSSSTYGDHTRLPKVEEKIGHPISPYAVTKLVNELYAKVYANLFGIEMIGLRYFNIFGPRQDPNGPYAAVIPLIVESILKNIPPTINGDGENTRDFTYVGNAVQANILSLFTENKKAINQVFNIGCGEQTSLNKLFKTTRKIIGSDIKPLFGPDRQGDVKHSLADISKAKKLLDYKVNVKVKQGLELTIAWFKEKYNTN